MKTKPIIIPVREKRVMPGYKRKKMLIYKHFWENFINHKEKVDYNDLRPYRAHYDPFRYELEFSDDEGMLMFMLRWS